MARRKVKNHNHWFVSVAMPKQGRLRGFDRRTETFPTETDAKQFAKEMLSEKHRMEKHQIVAGRLLGAYLPVRRIISGSQLYSWVKESDLDLTCEEPQASAMERVWKRSGKCWSRGPA